MYSDPSLWVRTSNNQSLDIPWIRSLWLLFPLRICLKNHITILFKVSPFPFLWLLSSCVVLNRVAEAYLLSPTYDSNESLSKPQNSLQDWPWLFSLFHIPVPGVLSHSTNIYWTFLICQHLQERVHWIYIVNIFYIMSIYHVYDIKYVLKNGKHLAKYQY